MTIGLVSAVAVLMASAGAGASGAPIKSRIDVSTPAAVKQYLRSIGVSPRGVVIQRGVRNYAGARCPGKDWTCTSTSHPVVQVAAEGGKNSFQGTTGSGAVIQVAAASSTNVAKCIRTTGITQSCSITQAGTGSNTAIVVEIATKTSGLTQNASQTAQIVQTARSGANTACVLQKTTIEGSTVAKKGVPVNVTLDAHQSISINQNSASGGNTVQNATNNGACLATPLDQTQTLTSKATGSGSITQRENATDTGPNMLLDIKQNQGGAFFGTASGPNSAVFNQTNTLTAVAVTPAGPVSQTQSSVNGGIIATVNQDSTGVNTAKATQTETQCEDARAGGPLTCDTTADPPGYSLTQTQFGPVKKGDGDSAQTGGNPGSRFTINQTSTQDNDTGKNQTNVVQGDCKTSGICRVIQTASVNGQETTNTQTGQDVSTSITCTGSTCTAPTPGITFDGSPGTASPPSTLGPYTMTAFGPDSQQVCPNAGSSVTGVTDPAGTIGFSQALRHDHAGTVGCWATWSHQYTGDVYDTIAATDRTQVTIRLPSGTNAFYFYAEPNQFQVLTITATAQDGTTSGPVAVQGNSGAQYFGFYGTGGETLSSITVTTSDTTGFAVGEFGINTRQIIN